jgi:hypothetical protein
VEHGATALGEKMSLIGKLMFTGLLFIIIGLLAAGMMGILLELKPALPKHAPLSTLKNLGLIVALLVGIGMLATMIAFYFNGILMTWSVK